MQTTHYLPKMNNKLLQNPSTHKKTLWYIVTNTQKWKRTDGHTHMDICNTVCPPPTISSRRHNKHWNIPMDAVEFVFFCNACRCVSVWCNIWVTGGRDFCCCISINFPAIPRSRLPVCGREFNMVKVWLGTCPCRVTAIGNTGIFLVPSEVTAAGWVWGGAAFGRTPLIKPLRFWITAFFGGSLISWNVWFCFGLSSTETHTMVKCYKV